MRWRRTVLAAVLCGVLASCSSAATAAGGGTSPTAVVIRYFGAITQHRESVARALVCPSGWYGPRHFRFVSFSYRDPTKAGQGSYFFQLQPHARPIPGGWLVALGRGRGPLSLPLFRVVQNGGRYFVCGYVKR